jgi:hypothetical protein
MSDRKRDPASPLTEFGHPCDDGEGVHLQELAPFTSLVVWTMNSRYRLVVTRGPEVYVQGGAFFPDPTLAHVYGASQTGRYVGTGWIGAGRSLEIRSASRHIITSPVLAIAPEEASPLVVH